MNDQVVSEIAEGVQTIRIERMDAENRLTAEMCERVADSLAFGESSSRVRAVLLTGTPGMFTAGHDANELQGFLTAGSIGESAIRLLKTIVSIDKPVVAAVDGPSFGFGTMLLILCDYVVASEWSIFSAAEAEMGLPPEGAASIIAPALMGYHRAFGLLVMATSSMPSRRCRRDGQQGRIGGRGRVRRPAGGARPCRQAAEAVRMHRRLMRGDRLDILQRIDQEADQLRRPVAFARGA